MKLILRKAIMILIGVFITFGLFSTSSILKPANQVNEVNFDKSPRLTTSAVQKPGNNINKVIFEKSPRLNLPIMPQTIPHILHQSWKTTELPAVSIEALTDRNSNDGERPGLTITPLGSTNYGRMKKIDSLCPNTIHGFSGLMMNCQETSIAPTLSDTCTCIITAGCM
jgi:hypothetical protein